MSADEAALLRSTVALVRQRYGLDEIEAAAYVVDMPSRIKALEAENAALRLRVVPEIVWSDYELASIATSGSVSLLIAEEEDGRWSITIGAKCGREDTPDGDAIEHLWRAMRPSRELAKNACSTAFLRMVGAAT